MKVYVNFPEDTDELENRLADFHANLIIEKIKNMDISNSSKKEVLNSILEQLNNEDKK